GHAGTRPWMLKTTRWLNSLALVQALRKALHRNESPQDRTLMEEMMQRTYVGSDDWRRRAAANNPDRNAGQTIQRSPAHGVPGVVCAPPTSERGLAPMGVDKLDRMTAATQQEVSALMSAAEAERRAGSAQAVATLQRILQLDPPHARAHYLLGQAL